MIYLHITLSPLDRAFPDRKASRMPRSGWTEYRLSVELISIVCSFLKPSEVGQFRCVSKLSIGWKNQAKPWKMLTMIPLLCPMATIAGQNHAACLKCFHPCKDQLLPRPSFRVSVLASWIGGFLTKVMKCLKTCKKLFEISRSMKSNWLRAHGCLHSKRCAGCCISRKREFVVTWRRLKFLMSIGTSLRWQHAMRQR